MKLTKESNGQYIKTEKLPEVAENGQNPFFGTFDPFGTVAGTLRKVGILPRLMQSLLKRDVEFVFKILWVIKIKKLGVPIRTPTSGPK